MSLSSSPYSVGRATVTRIYETTIDGLQATYLLPQLDLAMLQDPVAGIASDQQPTPQGDLLLPVNVWLVQKPPHTILIDTGVGNGKRRSHRQFDMLDTPFLETLAQAGVNPDEVDLVLITHLHVDHVGWNTQFVDDA